MNSVRLDLIQEIDQLWDAIYPYLAQHIHELYGRRDGDVLEIAPFCGVIFSLLKEKVGHSFFIATFPEGMGNFFRQEGKRQKLSEKIEILETNPSLVGVGENRFDLAIFRGALFFPTLFQVDFSALYRIVKKGGMALRNIRGPFLPFRKLGCRLGLLPIPYQSIGWDPTFPPTVSIHPSS